MMNQSPVHERIAQRLRRLYGDAAPKCLHRFQYLLGRYGVEEKEPGGNRRWGPNDVVLITYADTIQSPDSASLQTLKQFATRHLKGSICTIHLLPFYPWSSDDGFSVVDYRAVDERYGSWRDVEALGGEFKLMFDLVLNHCSARNRWFRDYVTGIAPASGYFLPTDPSSDLSAVVRPRPWPLLTKTATRDGVAHVWTTFSGDQVDLNWRNPDVLFEFLDILFLYLSKGCHILRLDAVAFLWKELGTDCMHRPETHEVVKLFRDVLELVAPEALIVTETNVPHVENISYFGQGDEAHMVYNFSLPPLLLHALLREDSQLLTNWARGLPELGPGQTFFNFTASHDGIGVRPLQGLVSDTEIQWLAAEMRARGGKVSMKRNSDGSESPYELNITYRSALEFPGDGPLSVARFLCSQAILLAFKGMPAIYFHSLVGTPNDTEGLKESGENRSINRRKYDWDELNQLLKDPENDQHRIFGVYLNWLRRRRDRAVFHPDAPMKVIELGSEFFAFERVALNGEERLMALFNVTSKNRELKLERLGDSWAKVAQCRDLLSGKQIRIAERQRLRFKPFQALWLYR